MHHSPRTTAAVLGVSTLALPTTAALAATTQATAASTKTVTQKKSFTGAPGQAHQWGNVEVAILVTKTTTTNTTTKKKTVKRRITSVKVPVSPNHTSRSILINQRAVPVLIQETISAQSARINLVSGASDSSNAFDQSLQSAILKSRAW